MMPSKGDRSSDVDVNLLDDSLLEMDNLAENFMDLELTDGGAQNQSGKRRLTVEE
jgi:hypothetical protein